MAIVKNRRQTRFTSFCTWCGERFESWHERAATCSGACRQRLATYKRELGWVPDEPPGPITAGAAIDLVIFELILQERRRRAALAALKSKFLAAKGGK